MRSTTLARWNCRRAANTNITLSRCVAPEGMMPSPCIGHLEGEKGEEIFVADVIRGRLAPFDPRASPRNTPSSPVPMVAARSSAILSPVSGCQRLPRCRCQVREFTAQQVAVCIWRRCQLQSWRVSIPNHDCSCASCAAGAPRAPSGRDTVDHGAHGSDDHANALCGCLYWRCARRASRRRGWVTCPKGIGRKNHLEDTRGEPEPRRSNSCRLDEAGNVLTPEQSRAMRHACRESDQT